jgi:CheY-like chemotaxis protein
MRKKRNLCCKQPYKLVVVDLNMPNLDGLGMMEQLKEEGQLNDTIFILASCQPVDTIEYKQHGFKYYLQKPFKVE